MKSSFSLRCFAIGAAIVILAPSVWAQSSVPRPAVGVTVGAQYAPAPGGAVPPPAPAYGSSSPAATVPAPLPRKVKLEVIKIPESLLPDAVATVQMVLQQQGYPQLNVIYGPGTEDKKVQALSIVNVSGADALQFLANAAGCTVEPMMSVEPATPQPTPGSAPVPPVVGYMFRSRAQQPPVYVNPVAVPVPGLPTVMRTTAAPHPGARTTRIYALGTATSVTKFGEIQTSLQDILKADGVAEGDVKLSLHEQTNILVVNATENVHGLVEQFLTALNQNNSQTERQNSFRDKLMGREEIEAAQRAKERLEQELALRDKELRELQSEVRRLQDQMQKSGAK